ncbi:MAG: NAD-reducing hydrogenase HoxS subunit beta [Lentisphaerae bacterium ADurb.BinA184]|nr:MAG: NAD-reducing hydrogenase HoxS subunit beta [Lentisphaerae bacterium ADurb.BinA184]
MTYPKLTDEKRKVAGRVVRIAPATRLEGHAQISVFLDEKGEVEDTYFQVVELRGFEEFCKGRPIDEIARITTRLCGVCPWPHHMAATKAVDMAYNIDPPPTAKKLRELGYCAHFLHSHIAHIYAMAVGPDLICGWAATPAERNIVGVLNAVGPEIGRRVLVNRAHSATIQEIIGGKATHPIFGLPGGISQALSAENRDRIAAMTTELVEFGKFTLEVVDRFILQNRQLLDVVLNRDLFYHETYYMGLVDRQNRANFYDGEVRIINPAGQEVGRFGPRNYTEYMAEHVVPWSYLKMPYLRKVGWKGFVDGPDSGIVRVAPLARLNVSDRLPTPLAQAAAENFFRIMGGKPVHHTLAFHWARAIEVMMAAERLQELISDPDITNPDVRHIPTEKPTWGVGIVAAPRGTLMHHYECDDKGLLTKINLLVASSINYPGMNLTMKKVAKALIHNGEVSDGILNMLEMCFRAYDPCFSCSTHALPGQMPMDVRIFDHRNQMIRRIARGTEDGPARD